MIKLLSTNAVCRLVVIALVSTGCELPSGSNWSAATNGGSGDTVGSNGTGNAIGGGGIAGGGGPGSGGSGSGGSGSGSSGSGGSGSGGSGSGGSGSGGNGDLPLGGQAPVGSCNLNGVVIRDGTSVQAYPSATVPAGQTCQAQTRNCSNGVLSGTAQFTSCSVQGATSCSFNGQSIANGNSVQAFPSATVPFGQTCQAQTRTCANGTLSGTNIFASCTVQAAAACAFNGQSVANGNSVQAFPSASVPFGQSCVAETRTCNNGALSGTNTFASCMVLPAAACAFNGQSVANGNSVQAFPSATVPFGQTCQAQTRTCNNGTLSGTNTFAACTVQPAAMCSFGNQALNSGQSITAYLNISVPAGQTCQSETRTCTNGALSGSYMYGACTVQAAAGADPLMPTTWTHVTDAKGPIPSDRAGHTAVWTGTEYIVWGGFQWRTGNASQPSLGDGAAYNPATNTWRTISAVGAPSPRVRHTAVWTGSQMIVFGGSNLAQGVTTAFGDGAAYTPATDSWNALPAFPGTPRSWARAYFLGTRMILVGGQTGSTSTPSSVGLNDAWALDVATASWSQLGPVMSDGTFPNRNFPLSVQTGDRGLLFTRGFFFGVRGSQAEKGQWFNANSSSWTPMSEANQLADAFGDFAMLDFTGSRILGYRGSTPNIVGVYNPADGSWNAYGVTGFPPGSIVSSSGATTLWDPPSHAWTSAGIINFGGEYVEGTSPNQVAYTINDLWILH